MPIRPENRRRYPANWKDIRASILARAQHRCEWCGVPNYAVGYRENGVFQPCAGNGPHDLAGRGRRWPSLRPWSYAEAQEWAHDCNEMEIDAPAERRYIVIVLTIAHVHDHAPENCDPGNLAALCQACHNRHDAPHRAAGIKARRGGTGLFDEVA